MDAESRLLSVIERFESAVVAYSGGVDSTVVAAAAHRVLGDGRMQAVIGVSPSVARSEVEAAFRVARVAGFPIRTVATNELSDTRYVANEPSRCYFCKSELYSVLDRVRQACSFEVVLDGFNRDDVGDFRPGAKAGQEHRVVSPLKEAGLGKEAVRAVARKWRLPNAEKPASPCLASRIPYHTRVTVTDLKQVEEAEAALHRLGLTEVRVRHHDSVARIEVPANKIAMVVENREAIVDAVKKAGYQFATVDLAGLKSGGFNTFLNEKMLLQ